MTMMMMMTLMERSCRLLDRERWRKRWEERRVSGGERIKKRNKYKDG